MRLQKILITGALGYLGSVLMPYLNEKGYETIGYDTGFFKDCTLWPSKDENIILKDMRNFQESDLNNIDVVVHLADISNDPFSDLNSEIIFKPTRKFSLEIAKLCKKREVKFIFASSCSVYGKASSFKPLTETSNTNPQTPYSLNKLLIEQELAKISDDSFSPICLRFATVFGPSPRIRFDLVLNMFVGMALTTREIILNSDGQAWRPNIYIKDVCEAFKQAIDFQNGDSYPLILNVGDTSQNFKILDLAKIVQSTVPDTKIIFMQRIGKMDDKSMDLVRDRKIQDGVDTRTYKVSFEKIKKVFKGFKCNWTVKDGVYDLYQILKQKKLSEQEFKNFNYYRLQKMEFLHKNSLIDDNLYWTNRKK